MTLVMIGKKSKCPACLDAMRGCNTGRTCDADLLGVELPEQSDGGAISCKTLDLKPSFLELSKLPKFKAPHPNPSLSRFAHFSFQELESMQKNRGS